MDTKPALLILYNPYYQKDVIATHLEILKDKGKVAFGKVRSKIKNQEQPNEQALQDIYAKTTSSHYLQLFLSDYANLFVAKVIEVSQSADESLIPSYYKQKDLDIEAFFIITDLRELVRENFSSIRDEFLSNFTTSNNHTYAIYGNNYVYPLIVWQKREIDYFANESKHFLSVYKNEEYLQIQQIFIDFVFGENILHRLHPDTIANLIFAELELSQNKQNPLYDFTSVIVKYSKSLEYEIYDFARKVLAKL